MKITKLIRGERMAPFATTDRSVLRAAMFAEQHKGLAFVEQPGYAVVIYAEANPDEETIGAWLPGFRSGGLTIKTFDGVPQDLDVDSVRKWLDQEYTRMWDQKRRAARHI